MTGDVTLYLSLAKDLMNQLGLGAFVIAFCVIALVIGVIQGFFHRG